MDKQHKNRQSRQSHRDRRWECLVHYSPRARPDKEQPICTICLFEDSRGLLIDHVNDNGAEHRRQIGRSSTQLYRFLIKYKFPSGYQTICANCSAIKEFIRRRKALKKNPESEEE